MVVAEPAALANAVALVGRLRSGGGRNTTYRVWVEGLGFRV